MNIQERILDAELRRRGVSPCKCGRVIDRADVAWNNACSEAGTSYSTVTIICLACDAPIAYWRSWYPEIEDFEELIDHVLDDWV
jgi:hypothetical protein